MESLRTNLDLFVVLRREGTSFDYEVLFSAVVNRLGDSISDEDRVTLKEFCRRFTRAASQRWQKSHRILDTFRKQYENWLQSNVDWPSCVPISMVMPQSSEEEQPGPSALSICPGPSTSCIGTMTKTSRKAFEDLGSKQKKRRSDDHKNENPNELAYSAAVLLKEEGREDIASVIEYMLKNPEAATKFNEMINKPVKKVIFTPEKALGLLLSLKLSKWQYMTLRETTIREGATDIYPSYYKVQQVKKQCYPSKQSVTVTDSSARITLQALLDITVKRILESLPESVQNKDLKLISKWGFDGASNQSRYKQKMDGQQEDSSIFMTSLVPLSLTDGDEILWLNPKPCSALYCRPVQFTFIKESEEVVISHKKQMDDEIKLLIPTNCNRNKVSHQLKMTMIDAKICTYLSEARSNASCYLCLAKPTEMNRLDIATSKTVNSDVYEFGLSSLHARINTMECLLHIAYRLDFKKWAARGQEHKDLLENRKRIIQNKFKDELNLLIDIVKQGSGTTNDGNTARRFFEFPDITAAITGLDEELVRRFAVILQAITSGEVIEVMKFKEYARKTAERYVELYDWYHMSSTVHKLLIHGADIIANNNIVPIGKLSEEASEARNKDFRRFREHNSRKMSRQASNADILNMLILSSDPLISSQRPKLETKKGTSNSIQPQPQPQGLIVETGNGASVLQLPATTLEQIRHIAADPGASTLRLPPPATEIPAGARESDFDLCYVCKHCKVAFPMAAPLQTHQARSCYAGREAVRGVIRVVQPALECRACPGERFRTAADFRRHADTESHLRHTAPLPLPVPEPLSHEMEDVVNQITLLAARAAQDATSPKDPNVTFCAPGSRFPQPGELPLASAGH